MSLISGIRSPVVLSPGGSDAGDFNAWALSSISNIPDGATAGDYGLLNGRVYRLTAALALPGGGTQAYWVSPEVYAGTVTVAAYLVGNESVSGETTLNLRGWSVTSRTNGAITSQTSRVRLATSAANGSVLISTLRSGVTASTKVYVRCLMRAVVGTQGGTQTTHIGFPAFGDTNNYTVAAYLSENNSKGSFFWTGSGTTSASNGIDRASQAAIPNLTGVDDLVEVIINTNVGARACEMWRNGLLVSTAPVVVGPFDDQVTFRAISGSSAGQTATLEISQVLVATW